MGISRKLKESGNNMQREKVVQDIDFYNILKDHWNLSGGGTCE